MQLSKAYTAARQAVGWEGYSCRKLVSRNGSDATPRLAYNATLTGGSAFYNGFAILPPAVVDGEPVQFANSTSFVQTGVVVFPKTQLSVHNTILPAISAVENQLAR